MTTLRREIGCVFVDEYQDTDPSQVRLLQVVAGDGRDVIVVGDPDQSIYAFRGAEARGILDFLSGSVLERAPAPVLALNRTRRFGGVLLAASRSVASRLGMPRSLPAEVFQAFRYPTADSQQLKGRLRSSCRAAPVRRRSTSPRFCAARTSATIWRGPTWRCWSALDGP